MLAALAGRRRLARRAFDRVERRRADARSRRDPARRPRRRSSGPDTSRSAAAWGTSDRLRTAAPDAALRLRRGRPLQQRSGATPSSGEQRRQKRPHPIEAGSRALHIDSRSRQALATLRRHELLHALAVMLLARVHVALRVDRDAADREELSRIAAAAAERCRPAPACRAAGCALSCRDRRRRRGSRCCGVVRERDVPHRAVRRDDAELPGHDRAERVLRDDAFLDELAVLAGTPECGCCCDRRRRPCRPCAISTQVTSRNDFAGGAAGSYAAGAAPAAFSPYANQCRL